MAFCSKCGNELTEGAKYCPKCGTPNPMESKSENKELQVENEESQIENNEGKEPIPMAAKVGLILSALLVIYGVVTINTSSFQGIVFIYCIAIGMLLVIWAAFKGMGNMDKKAAYWTIIAALISFPIIKGAEYLFDMDESEENETEIVEQKQESPEEKVAREKSEKQEKIDRMMREAYNEGKSIAMKYTYYEKCDQHFFAFYFTPETDEQIALFKRYKAEYDKGWEEGKRIKAKMDD